MRKFGIALAAVLTLSACSESGVDGEALLNAGEDGANWITYGRTYDEQRFSPLDQINTANVGELGLAWFADMDTARGQEATPLVIDGKLYLTTAWSKVKAYNGVTGALLWEYDPEVPGETACRPGNGKKEERRNEDPFAPVAIAQHTQDRR